MKKPKKSIGMIAFVGIMLVAILAFGGVMKLIETQLPDSPMQENFLENSKEDDFARREPLQTIKIKKKKYHIYHKIKTYLLMGTDASGNEEAEGDAYQGSMSDFLMLAVFDQTSKTYGFLQLNRDTMVEVPLMMPNGESNASATEQLCTAHWYGGSKEMSAQNTVKTVSDMFGGLNIDGYYVLSMNEIVNLNQELGGVTVTLEDDFTQIDEKMKKGATITLSNQQAEYYLHSRFGIGDESNLSRMKRQEQYMTKCFTKIRENIDKNVNYGNQIFKKFKGVATTDISMKMVGRIGKDMKNGASLGVMTIDGKATTGKALDDGKKHVEFYMNENSMIETLGKLYGLEEAE